MKNKIAVGVVMAAVLGFLSQGSAFANDEGGEMAFRFDPATMSSRALEYKNTLAGYKLFRSNCKSCHYRGNDKGAQFLDTDSRTMRGWNAVFFKKNVRCAKDGTWAKLSSEELTYVNDYLYSKAYDTWDANTARSCG
jgi:mono/diheme cytochrome c family protein